MATSLSRSVTEEEEENFFHIYKLVVGIGTEAVRDAFNITTVFSPSSILTTLKKEETKIRALRVKKILTTKQIDILFPSSGTTSSKQYDISLMVCLIRNFTRVTSPTNGFDKLPSSTETSMEADLARIKYYRNKVAHADSLTIANIEFNGMWQDLVNAIVRLGGIQYKSLCDELKQTKFSKNCISDMRLELAKCQEEIRDNHQQFKQDIYHLETKVGKVNEMLQATMTSIDTNQQKMQEGVTGLKDENMELNKSVLQIKTEQVDLRTKLEESTSKHANLGISVGELHITQQQIQREVETIQHNAADNNLAVGKVNEMLQATMTSIDTNQQKMQEGVTGLKDENMELNKSVLQIKTEQVDLRTKLVESTSKHANLGISVGELHITQQQIQREVETIQHNAADNNLAGKEEVEGLKYEITTCKDDNERIRDIVKRLKREAEDHVPQNIRDQIRQEIDGWKIKDTKFICTRAYDDVLAKISLNSCVTVTGSSGSGKSAIVRHVSMLLCGEQGYDIITVSFPIELKNYYKPGKKTLFVLDDVCGSFTANKVQIDDWLSIMDVVNQVIADDCCKMLLSCRLQVYKDEKFSELKPFQSCECNITSDQLSLTTEEKKAFVKTYLKLDNIDVDNLSRNNNLFPFLCESYLSEKVDDIEKYFNMPYHVYQKELETLRINKNYKLCGLCLCVMLNNQVKEGYFERLTKKFREIVKDICEYCGLDKWPSPISLREELENLENTYIKKQDGVYKIYHDKLFDFIAYYFGKRMTQCFIDHADSGFLRERFLWENAIDTDEHLHTLENIILLTDEYLQSYIDRMKNDWLIGKVSDTFYNINMGSSLFRKEFLRGLSEIDKEEAIKLSNIKDGFRKDFASGNTPLIISAVNGYVDLLQWLLEHKANVNDRRNDGSTALYMACQKNCVDAVNILLENNAEVNSCTDDNVSPLGIVCYLHGNLHIISKLLSKNAEVNKYRYKENNMTPLFMACQNNFITIVQELLEYGADTEIYLNDGMSVLLFACQNRYTELVRLLIQYKANTNAEMQDGDTPLLSVSRMGFTDITELLLQHGADFNKCLYSKEKIEKLHASPESLENEKQAWLDDVASSGSQCVVEYISTKSADYVFDVFTESSPLHAACYMGHIEICKLLIEKHTSVDIRKEDGTTPLFYACELGHLEIVRRLLEKGADPNICRKNQSSSLTIAEENGHTDVLTLLTKQ